MSYIIPSSGGYYWHNSDSSTAVDDETPDYIIGDEIVGFDGDDVFIIPEKKETGVKRYLA